MKICSPKGFEADSKIVEKARSLSEFGSKISISNDPVKAIKDAQVIYTDVWASMGQEEEHLKRKKIFENYKVCLLYTSPSPRDRTRSRMPSSA